MSFIELLHVRRVFGVYSDNGCADETTRPRMRIRRQSDIEYMKRF